MTSLVCSTVLRRGAIFGAACALFVLVQGCGSRSGLPDDGLALTDSGGAGSAGGGGGSSSLCRLAIASPASIPLISFPEGDADTPMLVVLDPGDSQAASGPRPARVATQAISEAANGWHPELRIAGLSLDVPWPEGATIDHPAVLAGTDAHYSGALGPGAGGGLAVLWYRGDEAADLPAGLKFRTFDSESWTGKGETFIDSEGTVAHALHAGKVDGTPSGADGYIASWSGSPAIGAFETHVAVLDASGAFTMGPFAVGAVDFTFATTSSDVIWSGESHLIATGATVCADNGPPCVSGAMSVFRIGSGGAEIVTSMPFVSPGAKAGRPSFARTGNAVWLIWGEWDYNVEPALRRLRLARLDAVGQLAGPPELLSEDSVPTASLVAASTDTDLLLAWAETVNPDLALNEVGHSRVVIHHRDAEGMPIDPPLAIETTSFAAYPSLSLVGIDYPHSVLVSWAGVKEGGTRAITYLSRLDCAAPD